MSLEDFDEKPAVEDDLMDLMHQQLEDLSKVIYLENDHKDLLQGHVADLESVRTNIRKNLHILSKILQESFAEQLKNKIK